MLFLRFFSLIALKLEEGKVEISQPALFRKWNALDLGIALLFVHGICAPEEDGHSGAETGRTSADSTHAAQKTDRCKKKKKRLPSLNTIENVDSFWMVARGSA